MNQETSNGEAGGGLGAAPLLASKGHTITFCFCPRCGVQMNPKHDASAQSDESRMDWLLKNSCIKVNNIYYTTRESLDAAMLANDKLTHSATP